MINSLIKEKVDSVSYSEIELSNINTTLSNLKNIINNQPEFKTPFLGGSYKRKTMVKGVSDVDVYFEYIGNGNAQSSLSLLKNCLVISYPMTIVKQDKPSILVDFNKIPINITPYRKNNFNRPCIPDKLLLNWKEINMEELEVGVQNLRNRNPIYIDLIKILKIWNYNYNGKRQNFEIEKWVCNNYGYGNQIQQNISGLMWNYFANNGYTREAQKIHALQLQTSNPSALRSDWIKFIHNG